MKKKLQPAFVEVVTALLVILFVYTGASKLVDYETFRIALRQSPLLYKYATVVSIVLPVTELLIVALLIRSSTMRAGLLASVLLMFGFTVYLTYMICTSSDLPCNCGGIIKNLSWRQHVVFNVIMLVLSGIAWKISKNTNKDFIAINRQSRTPV